jgi:Holliday junction resolvase RusA-like endonuclease
MHWGPRKRYGDLWRTLIRAEIDNSHKPCRKKMRVVISQMRKRLLDPDNLVASVKPILDALVDWKLIKDDSNEWIELDVRQTTGKEPMTIIHIQPME